MCLRKNKKGSYNIVHPGRKRFANYVEVAIADFIVSGDAKSFNRVPDSDPFFVGAAIESACNGLDIDCGNYYQTIFTIMSAGFGAWGGAYPSPGTGPNVAGNNTVPSSMQRDVFGDPDCPGCGYDWHLSMSQAPGNPRTTVLGYSEDVTFYKDVYDVNVNILIDQKYYSWEGMNAPFLDAAMYRGDTIIYVSNPNRYPYRTFPREVNYIQSYTR